MKKKLILCTVLLTLSMSSFGMKRFFNILRGGNGEVSSSSVHDDLEFLFDSSIKGTFKRGVARSVDEWLYRGSDQDGDFMSVACSSFSGIRGFFLKKYKSGKKIGICTEYSTENWSWKDVPIKISKLTRDREEELEWFLKKGELKGGEIVVEFENPLKLENPLKEEKDLSKLEEGESSLSEDPRKKSFLEMLYSFLGIE